MLNLTIDRKRLVIIALLLGTVLLFGLLMPALMNGGDPVSFDLAGASWSGPQRGGPGPGPVFHPGGGTETFGASWS